MFHVLGHYGSLAATADTLIPALADPGWRRDNNAYIANGDWQIRYIAGLGDLLLRVKFETPRTQMMGPIYSGPVFNAATFAQGWRPADYSMAPILWRSAEKLELKATNSAAGPTDTKGIVLAYRQFRPAPQGERYLIRGTDSTTVTADAWSDLDVTWDTNLPAGQYAVIGGWVEGATCVAWGLVFADQVEKPGAFGVSGPEVQPWHGQVDGSLGLLGVFDTNTYPTVQTLCNAADTSATIYLVITRIR